MADLNLLPSPIIEQLRAWFFAKDRSIVMAASTFIRGTYELIFQTGNPTSEAMRIDETGNVGIGTDLPKSPLHVVGNIRTDNSITINRDGSDSVLIFTETDINQWTIRNDIIGSGSANALQIRGDGGSVDTFLTILQSGEMGIGTNDPKALLHSDQASTTAAIPVLYLDQADISEEMIEFNTTIGVGNAIEAVGGKILTTTHFIKVTLPGAITRYIPCGTIA